MFNFKTQRGGIITHTTETLTLVAKQQNDEITIRVQLNAGPRTPMPHEIKAVVEHFGFEYEKSTYSVTNGKAAIVKVRK